MLGRLRVGHQLQVFENTLLAVNHVALAVGRLLPSRASFGRKDSFAQFIGSAAAALVIDPIRDRCANSGSIARTRRRSCSGGPALVSRCK
jgi:hypothetical protein